MDTVTLLKEVRSAGCDVSAAGGRLTVRGPRAAEELVNRLLGRKAEVLGILTGHVRDEPSPRPNDKRWSPADEEGSRPCRHCGGPIVFGQVASDTADPKAVGRWIPQDPDLHPHCCGYRGDQLEREAIEAVEAKTGLTDG